MKIYPYVQRCVRESPDWTHFNLFPRSLGEILAQYSVQELRLSLTQVEIIQGTIDWTNKWMNGVQLALHAQISLIL